MSIKVENLSKNYGDTAAVKNISFEIKTGEIVGFLGPNGAGKSTTMKMITTYLTPTEGTITVNGEDTEKNSMGVRKKIGYLPESNPLYLDMNVVDYLIYCARLEGMEQPQIDEALPRIVKKCGLKEMVHKDIGELSKGYKQRVGLAQAMIHDPEVLILDEPTSGLDPNQIGEIRKLIKELGKEKTLILSTHILQEVQATCDRVLIIANGEIVADGSPDELQAKFKGQVDVRLTIKKEGAPGKDELIREIESVHHVDKAKVKSETDKEIVFEIRAQRGSDIREGLFKKMGAKNAVVLELHQEETSLEDIFRELTLN